MPNQYGIPNPNGCTYCGVDERGHALLWLRSTGWHKWTAPSDGQRLERMKERRKHAMALGN